MEDDTIIKRAQLIAPTPAFFTRICHGLEKPWYCTLSLFQSDPNHVQEEGELLDEEQRLVDRGILVHTAGDNISPLWNISIEIDRCWTSHTRPLVISSTRCVLHEQVLSSEHSNSSALYSRLCTSTLLGRACVRSMACS